MCGRYVLALRPSEVRRRLEEARMPAEEAPEDDELRQSYNFAPGYHGLVYRADGPDYGGDGDNGEKEGENIESAQADGGKGAQSAHKQVTHETRYRLQAMKWGLIPFWTKRNPDYGSMLKTINCRDDSLIENRGMWASMKKKKRCIVVAQGFYEWLKKSNKEKIPHFVKRKDGQLMCFAGLWDCVKFEDTEEKLYTYTIITTNSNKQLNFLHDRMPVILNNGSNAIKIWLDPKRTEWSKELQSLLKPYDGELECFPVSKEVGKVGNNSPSFVVPVNSTENKSNIANFFGNQRKAAEGKVEEKLAGKMEDDLKIKGVKVEYDKDETRDTTDQQEGTEDNTPLPTPARAESQKGIKREHNEADDDGGTADGAPQQKRRISAAPVNNSSQSPKKFPSKATRKTRSSTSNGTATRSSPNKASDGSQKITAFFSR